MILAMTRTIHAKQCQLHSIAISHDVSLKTREGTPYELYVKVDVEGPKENQDKFLRELELRFGFTSVWEV